MPCYYIRGSSGGSILALVIVHAISLLLVVEDKVKSESRPATTTNTKIIYCALHQNTVFLKKCLLRKAYLSSQQNGYACIFEEKPALESD